MSLRALVVTKDDRASETLASVVELFGLTAHSSGYGDAVCLVSEQRFHAVVVDFDDPHSATLVLDSLASSPFEVHPVTVALLGDRSKVRKVFGAGAHFIVYKPVTPEQAKGTLRAAVSLIQQDRRTSFRVPIQVPLSITLESGGDALEGLLIDLSADGADLLSPQPLYPLARLSIRCSLPEFPFALSLRGEVQWANPSGESGVRFTGTPEKVRSALRRWAQDHRREPTSEESIAIQNCKLTDLSLGACYIETPSPFPEGTYVTLTLRADQSELEAHGMVRVMHPSHGMGVVFPNTARARRETEGFIRFLASRPGLQPELQVSPGPDELAVNAAAAADFEDPLLELLHRHEDLTQETFLAALESQRKISSTPSR